MGFHNEYKFIVLKMDLEEKRREEKRREEKLYLLSLKIQHRIN